MKIERLACGLQVKFVEGDSGTQVGTFKGYGSIFGNVDSYGDVVAAGAFKKTLKEWKARDRYPPMLLQHGAFGLSSEDGIPVGVYTKMEEDDKGLYVEGKLFALETQRGQYIHEGLKSGALDGLSIGYIPRDVAYGKKPDEPRRTLKVVDLREVSIVTYPANDRSRITGAKAIDTITKLSEAEDFLRSAGFSDSQAVAFVSRIKGLRPSDSESATTDVAAMASRLLSQITT